MTLIQQLIDSTHFAQAQNFWQENIGEAVFEPFFACMLANLASSSKVGWYENFIATTATSAKASLSTGGTSPNLASFWQLPEHLILRQKIAESTFAEPLLLTNVLPLAAHTGFGVLHTLAEQEGISIYQLALNHLDDSLAKLPAWADSVVDETVLASLDVEQLLAQSLAGTLVDTTTPQTQAQTVQTNTSLNITNDSPTDSDSHLSVSQNTNSQSTDNSPALDDTDIISEHQPSPKATNPLVFVGLALAGLGLVLGGGYYYYQKTQAQKAAAEAAATTPATPSLVVEALPPSTLSITVGQAGEMYACHAELGSNDLSNQFYQILQNNFTNTLCVIDIHDSLSKSMVGLDKLTSMIGLLKTAPYATLQLKGDTAYINAPNPSDIQRLIADIGALVPQLNIQAMPALDAVALTQDNIATTQAKLAGLPSNATDQELARALSVQLMDTTQSILPDANKALLATSAPFLKDNSNIKLIIVAHSDDMGDPINARIQTQAVADKIKNELMALGVNDMQLVAQGVGSDFPVADNVTDIGRFNNRRVEFLVYDDAIMQALAPKATPVPTTAMPTTPMPTDPATTAVPTTAMPVAPAQPTLDVVNGQIVEAGNQAPIVPNQAPSYPNVGEQPVINIASGDSLPSVPVAPSNNNASPIPAELLTPVYSDTSGGKGAPDIQISSQ